MDIRIEIPCKRIDESKFSHHGRVVVTDESNVQHIKLIGHANTFVKQGDESFETMFEMKAGLMIFYISGQSQMIIREISDELVIKICNM